MEQSEAGCQTPERQILCINDCGFFGSAATMNMCSKCHRELILKQEQKKKVASSFGSVTKGPEDEQKKKVASSFGSITKGPRRKNMKEPVVSSNIKIVMPSVELTLSLPEPSAAVLSDTSLMKAKEGPSRCGTCRKRLGLTGFTCRCGNLYCSMHRYSDKHDCQFDYKASGRDAIAKANPIVKTEKLYKI